MVRCAAIHGDKDQHERTRTLESFKRGQVPVMIATDVAARGVDVKNVAAVVNYDFPQSVEDYVHRIGDQLTSPTDIIFCKFLKILNF
jgi:ATP-dependent RNA helicase DDX5/DBP2